MNPNDKNQVKKMRTSKLVAMLALLAYPGNFQRASDPEKDDRNTVRR